MARPRFDLEPGEQATLEEHIHLMAARISREDGTPMWRVMRVLANVGRQVESAVEATPAKPIKWTAELPE